MTRALGVMVIGFVLLMAGTATAKKKAPVRTLKHWDVELKCGKTTCTFKNEDAGKRGCLYAVLFTVTKPGVKPFTKSSRGRIWLKGGEKKVLKLFFGTGKISDIQLGRLTCQSAG